MSLLLAHAGHGAGADATTVAIERACGRLGARCSAIAVLAPGTAATLEEADCDAAVERALGAAGEVDMLVVDGASLYAAAAAVATGGDRDRGALSACLDASWKVTRSLANRAFLARERAGRVVLIAPAPPAGAHADAARAGLENLARTLSIEWARRRITAVAIAPGATSVAGEVAALTAYLASPAGAYFSGCLLDLRGG
jgi:NAD(P)-dependent dehydrogenase (short-subunit alcohol dehydrogenase family)